MITLTNLADMFVNVNQYLIYNIECSLAHVSYLSINSILLSILFVQIPNYL
jgi:hypothetical protein